MRFLVLLALAACGSDVDARSDGSPDRPDAQGSMTDDPDGGLPTDASPTACEDATVHSDFAWIQSQILTPSCATAMCHAGANPAVYLSLEDGAAYANLVGRESSTQAGWTRVVAGSPASSYLVVALGRASGPPPRDGFMPLGADALCVEKLEAIERWIGAGAQR